MINNKEEIRKKENHRVFKQLLTTFIQVEEQKLKGTQEKEEYAQNIKIIPKIFYNEFTKQLKVEFKIGDKQLYKLKNLPEFYERMLNQEVYQYGNKLNIIHKAESFEEQSMPILQFLLKYAEIMKYNNEVANGYSYYTKNFVPDNILISNTGLDDFFDSLQNKEVLFQKGEKEKTIYFKTEEPQINFHITQVKKDEFKLNCNIDVFSYEILQGKEYLYLLCPKAIYRISKQFKNTTLKLLEVLRKNYTNEIIMDIAELTSFFAMIAPNMEEAIQTQELPKIIQESCIPKKLGVKIYLDYDVANNITADIKFCYGEEEFNPLLEQKQSFARNIIGENEALNTFIQTGFMLDKNNNRLILANDSKIFSFLSEEIENYMKKYEVLATDSFRKKQINTFNMESVGIRLENHLLEIDLSQIGIDLTDLAQMLEKYNLKKKFHRLKDRKLYKIRKYTNDAIFARINSRNGYQL